VDRDTPVSRTPTWDALPSEAKAVVGLNYEIENATKKELNGTHLMVFFLECRIKPLQAQISKLWTYSGATDPSRVSPKDPLTKDLEKMV
jgi:hypothetical protein